MDSNDGKVIRKIGKGKNLGEAIDIVCEETKTEIIEYGIEFADK